MSISVDERFWKTNERRKCNEYVKESMEGVVVHFKSYRTLKITNFSSKKKLKLFIDFFFFRLIYEITTYTNNV